MYWIDDDPRDDDFPSLATMAEAHAEWHRNTGVPMGTPGCPQDACHADEYEDEDDSDEDEAILAYSPSRFADDDIPF
jgi:hypothetical protein